MTIVISIVIMMMHGVIMIVMVRRHASKAGRHRIWRSRILIRLGRRHAGIEASLQQPGQDILRVLAQKEAASHQIVDRLDELCAVLTVRRIALLHRWTGIARGETIGERLGERNVLSRRLASIVRPSTCSQPPARVGRERHGELRQADARDIIAVAIRLWHVAWVDRAVRRIVLIGRRDARRIDRRDERLVEVGPEIEPIARRLQPV